MIIIDEKVYSYSITGDFINVGVVVRGIDCYFIKWYN